MACSLEYNGYITCWHLFTGCTWRLSSQDSREGCVTSMRIPHSWKSMAWAQSLRPHSTWAKSVPTCTRPKSEFELQKNRHSLLMLSKDLWGAESLIKNQIDPMRSKHYHFCEQEISKSMAFSFLSPFQSLLKSCQYSCFEQKYQWNQLKNSQFE